MSTQQLYIPEKIKVGFQKREGTYTGKLAYVIYYDHKGVLRKEKSWLQWRDSKIKDVEFTNEPVEGFVLNKGVGGQRQSYGWNARNEYIRVYDPRDFEIEISVANLLFILRECDCSRGKGLEGKFCYAWDGTELVLLPAVSDDYKNSQKYTELQGKGVSVKVLILGATYSTKKQKDLVYLGRFDYHFLVDPYRPAKVDLTGKVKRHVFWDGKQFVYMNEVKSLAVLRSATPAPDYAKLVDKYNKSARGTPVKELYLKSVPSKEENNRYHGEFWYCEESPGVFLECQTHFKYGPQGYTKEVEYVVVNARYRIQDGVFKKELVGGYMYPVGSIPSYRSGAYNYETRSYDPPVQLPYVAPTDHRLFALLESGAEFRVEYNTFNKEK